MITDRAGIEKKIIITLPSLPSKMGTGKKEATRRVRQSAAGKESASKPGNLRVKGENFYRDAKKVKQVNLLRGGHAKHNAAGEVVQAAAFQSTEVPKARVQPDRRWFNNTRVISQDALTQFRERMAEQKNDPYAVLLKRNKLPMSLLDVSDRPVKANLIESEPFDSVFGRKSLRKRPKVNVSSLDDLVQASEDSQEAYEQKQTLPDVGDMGESYTQTAREAIFSKGQSKRIWNELYKVIDSSDVLIHVLDARDPLGTRCLSVEKYLQNDAPHKHLIYILNKCDLVPTSVAVSFLVLRFLYLLFVFRAKVKSRRSWALRAYFYWETSVTTLAEKTSSCYL